MTTALEPQAMAQPQYAQPTSPPPQDALHSYSLDKEGSTTRTILGMPVYGFVLYALWTPLAVFSLAYGLNGVLIIWVAWTGCRIYDEVRSRSKPTRLVADEWRTPRPRQV